MNKIEKYRNIKREADSLMTEEEIHKFIDKYKLLPTSIIEELQEKLNRISQQPTTLKGSGL